MPDAEQPRTITRLWPDDQHGPFRLRISFGAVDGREAVVGVEMWGIEPPSGNWSVLDALPEFGAVNLDDIPDTPILAADIRLRLGAILDAWVAQNLAHASAARKLWGDSANLQKFQGRFEDDRKGRPHLSDDFLRRVETIYNEAVTAGDRRPAVRVQQELGARTASTARSWIRQARRRGFDLPQPSTKADQED